MDVFRKFFWTGFFCLFFLTLDPGDYQKSTTTLDRRVRQAEEALRRSGRTDCSTLCLAGASTPSQSLLRLTHPTGYAGFFMVASAFAQDATAPVVDNPETRQFDFANGWLNRGNYQQAAREYEKFKKDFSNSLQIPLANARLGEAYYFLKDYPKAEEALNLAASQVTDLEIRRHVQYRLGEVEYHLGKYDLSKDLLATVLAAQPQKEISEACLYYKGQSLLKLAKKEEAVATLQELLDKYPNDKFVFFSAYDLGKTYRDLGQLDKALQAYGIIQKATPGDPRLPGDWALPESYYRQGEILYEKGQFEDSAKTLQAALDKYPKTDLKSDIEYSLGWSCFGKKDYKRAAEIADALIPSSSAPARAQGLQILKGNSLYEQANYIEAALCYATASQADSSTADAKRKTAEALSKLAWCHYFAKNYDESLKAIDAAIQLPEIGVFLGDMKFLKGQILYIKEDYNQALLEFLDVLANHKDSRFFKDVGYRMGWTYYKVEKYKEAAELWFTYALRFPEEAEGREAALMAAEATFKSGDFEQALEKFDHYITTYPQMPDSESVLYRAAVACYNLQKTDKMSAYLKQLLERFPNSQYAGEAIYWLGVAASSQNKSDEAEKLFTTLSEKYPQSEYAADGLYRLGLIYYQSKRNDLAIATLFRVVKDYPKYVISPELLQWLGGQIFDAKRFEDAYTVYSSLWEKHPNSRLKGRAQFEGGRCLLELKKFDQAETLFSLMLKENPEGGYRGFAEYGLGMVLMEAKKFPEALKNLEDSQRYLVDEWTARAAFASGVCYRESGQGEQAFDAFMRVAILYDLPSLSDQALWEAGQVKEKLNDWPEAEKCYRELLTRYPNTDWGKKTQELLNSKASQ